MRTVLHLGAHKTGTSLIQKYFRDNPRLTAEVGIAYVPRGDMNHLVRWGTEAEKHPERLRDRLTNEAARAAEVILVSHENALGRPVVAGRDGLYPKALRFARALLAICEQTPDLDPHIVYYVRPLEEFLESYFLQTVHQGRTHSFAEWFARFDPASLAWGPVIAALDETFGADRVSVGDFREIKQGQHQFLRNFIRRAGLPEPPEVAYIPIRNPSVSDRGLRMALDINPLLKDPKERKAVRGFLQRNFNNRRETRARPMPESVREQLRRSDEPDYQRLAARARVSLGGAVDSSA
jgi:hypothetical protein